MEFETTFSQLIYRIEPRPGGGFIATAKDPAAPAIEGATREEVQQKVQERIAQVMAARLPDLQSALAKNGVHLHYHIEPKAGGGYTFHHGDPASADPAHAAVEGTTREHLENFIEAKIFSAIMNHLPPEVRGELEQKINAGGLDIDVARAINVTTLHDGRPTSLLDFAPGGDLPSSSKPASEVVSASSGDLALSAQSASLNSGETTAIGWSGSSPVTRYEKSSSGSLFRLLLLLGIAALLAFLYLYRR